MVNADDVSRIGVQIREPFRRPLQMRDRRSRARGPDPRPLTPDPRLAPTPGPRRLIAGDSPPTFIFRSPRSTYPSPAPPALDRRVTVPSGELLCAIPSRVRRHAPIASRVPRVLPSLAHTAQCKTNLDVLYFHTRCCTLQHPEVPVTQSCPPPFGAISTSDAQAFSSMRTSFGAVTACCTVGYPAAKPVSV